MAHIWPYKTFLLPESLIPTLFKVVTCFTDFTGANIAIEPGPFSHYANADGNPFVGPGKDIRPADIRRYNSFLPGGRGSRITMNAGPWNIGTWQCKNEAIPGRDGIVRGVMMSRNSPLRPENLTPRLGLGKNMIKNIRSSLNLNSRFTFGEPKNITLEVLQQNGPGTIDQLLWITSIVCDEFNPNDNICNIPGMHS